MLIFYYDKIFFQTIFRISLLDMFHVHLRVATAQGKQGIWFLLFPDRDNTGNFVVTQGKFLRHREIFLTVFISTKSMFLFTYFQIFLALLCSAWFLISKYCYMNYFYQYIYCTNILTVLCHILTSINQTYSGTFKNKLKWCNWEYVQLLFLNVTCFKHFNKKYEMSFCLSNTIWQG